MGTGNAHVCDGSTTAPTALAGRGPSSDVAPCASPSKTTICGMAPPWPLHSCPFPAGHGFLPALSTHSFHLGLVIPATAVLPWCSAKLCCLQTAPLVDLDPRSDHLLSPALTSSVLGLLADLVGSPWARSPLHYALKSSRPLWLLCTHSSTPRLAASRSLPTPDLS